MKKALLLIDRGSKEQDVKDELNAICSLAKERGGYYIANYAFLEVTPPYIEEGINSCVKQGVEFVTIMPYFLYPGMKLKVAVKQSEEIASKLALKYAITECLNYHAAFVDIVRDRINEVKQKESVGIPDKECDILLIGHGSSDRDARDAFIYIANSIRQIYRNVSFCFLELDKPNIEEGIKQALANNPQTLVLVPYFLHKGAHVKHDVKEEVEKAIKNSSHSRVYMARHLGVDEKIVDVVLERAKEVESKFGV
ncbi:MAG: CbiX/SirB N-terminal domain-containing protein [Nitrososphaerales archaeon]